MMGAYGALYCGRCGTRYLRRADPEHCSACGREIDSSGARRHLCEDCAGREEWE